MKKIISKIIKFTPIFFVLIVYLLIPLEARAQSVQCLNLQKDGSCTSGEYIIRYTGVDEFGNREFNVKKVSLGTDERYIDSPFLTDYLAAMYKYAVIATTILVTVVIIFAGVLYITSAGNTEQTGRAKKMIARAITGLVLAVGSYTILWTINPQLVEFGGLKILRIEKMSIEEALFEDSDNIVFDSTNAGLKPNWDENTFECSKKDTYQQPGGGVDKKSLHTFTDCPGTNAVIGDGKFTLKKEMGDALCKVAKKLNETKEEYRLYIGGSYRPFDEQVKKWCDVRHTKKYPDPAVRKRYLAIPGTSKHGYGIAVDVKLLDKDKKILFEADGATQCNVKPEYVKIIAQAFYDTDPNFVRYEPEIWHFEYGTSGKGLRSKTTTLPADCSKK